MTGRGCDDIFRILDNRNLTFGDMFWHCERRYGLDNFHFTRLDVAIDDRNEKPFFTIEQIMILSILVDTFISKISLTMQPGPKIDSISGA